MSSMTKGQRGFTLIELIVVIAILGVLAAVATPLITNYLSASKERAYTAEKELIQNTLDANYSAPDNARFLGKRQYSIIGKEMTGTSTTTQTTTAITPIVDDASPFDSINSTTSSAFWNANGGTQGMDLTGKWTDSGDGVRTKSSSSTDKWTTVTVVRGGVTYHTDPRYYFINFEALVNAGLLKEVPKSAAPDNAPSGSTLSYTGSYIWYVDDKGKVQSLYTELPSTKGQVSGIFP